MTKWFLYIVTLLLLAPLSLYPREANRPDSSVVKIKRYIPLNTLITFQQRDTVTKGRQKPSNEDKKKIKEIAKAKKLPKPEKIEEVKTDKPKPPRKRRPEGVERPPEIPRRNE